LLGLTGVSQTNPVVCGAVIGIFILVMTIRGAFPVHEDQHIKKSFILSAICGGYADRTPMPRMLSLTH
jgi:hypothetical protein